ncbi:MAG: hypothetical protein L6R39_004344 [Caloplaca ligustica]|nr:MAG: hypothetical protein L6R39_004344 [Caloplaca ligustica]
MCRVHILVYGCGHRRFLRLVRPCPAGLCSQHNECYQDRTRTTRRYRVLTPPFCKKCFDKEKAEIDKAFIRVEENFAQNHDLVRRYLRARNGHAPTQEDQNRIRQRLRKNRNANQELLEIEFYGPTRRIPNSSSALLYWRWRRSTYSHQECMRAYSIAHTAFQDGDDQRDTLDEAGSRDEQLDGLEAAQLADDDSAQASEDGEYFQTWRRAYQLTGGMVTRRYSAGETSTTDSSRTEDSSGSSAGSSAVVAVRTTIANLQALRARHECMTRAPPTADVLVRANEAQVP